MAISWASWDATGRVQFDVTRQIIRIVDGVSGFFPGLHAELLDGGINLPHVINASSGLRFGAGMHEVGNGDGGQHTDDGHHNHDLHQRETRPVRGFGSFHTMLFFLTAA